MFHQSGLSDSDRKITKTFENQTKKPKNHGNKEKNQENRKEVNKENFKENREEERVQTMKTLLKVALVCAALAVMSGCSAQRRAERHVRKAVALCPELVQLKAHIVDTTLYAPAFADMAAVPLAAVLSHDTLYAATTHGTVVVSLRKADTVLRVGFVAAPQTIRYRDTVRYAQVTVAPDVPKTNGARAVRFWPCAACVLGGIVVGIFAIIVIALKTKIVD